MISGRFIAAIIMLAMPAAPAAGVQTANGHQIIEDFEGYAAGPLALNFCVPGAPQLDCLGTLTGGTVAAASPAFPAASGTQVYTGTSISLSIADFVNYSWPAVGARVTGTAPVRLQVWEYDDLSLQDVLIFDGSTPGNAVNSWLGFGSESNPLFLTRFTYSSSAAFAIDDLALGLPSVVPGVPEPASWAMLIAGFGLAGAMQRRRKQSTSTGRQPCLT